MAEGELTVGHQPRFICQMSLVCQSVTERDNKHVDSFRSDLYPSYLCTNGCLSYFQERISRTQLIDGFIRQGNLVKERYGKGAWSFIDSTTCNVLPRYTNTKQISNIVRSGKRSNTSSLNLIFEKVTTKYALKR